MTVDRESRLRFCAPASERLFDASISRPHAFTTGLRAYEPLMGGMVKHSHATHLRLSLVQQRQRARHASESSAPRGDESPDLPAPLDEPFQREGFGRQSLSEKRHGHRDPADIQTYLRVKNMRGTATSSGGDSTAPAMYAQQPPAAVLVDSGDTEQGVQQQRDRARLSSIASSTMIASGTEERGPNDPASPTPDQDETLTSVRLPCAPVKRIRSHA